MHGHTRGEPTGPEHSEAHGHTCPGVFDRGQEGQPTDQSQLGEADRRVSVWECHILLFSLCTAQGVREWGN